MAGGAHLAGVAPRAVLNCEPAVDSFAPLGGVTFPEQRNISRVAGQQLAEGHGLDSPARQRVRSYLPEGQGPDSPPRLPKQTVCPPGLTRGAGERVAQRAGGAGPPLRTSLLGKSRPFTDGGGLCSLGRWGPSRRPQCNEVGAQCFKALDDLLRKRMDPSKLLYELACRKHELYHLVSN